MRKRWLRKLKLGKTCFFFSKNKEKPIFRTLICVFIIAIKSVRLKVEMSVNKYFYFKRKNMFLSIEI